MGVELLERPSDLSMLKEFEARLAGGAASGRGGRLQVGGGKLRKRHNNTGGGDTPTPPGPLVVPESLIGGFKKGVSVGAGYETQEAAYFAQLVAAGCKWIRVTANWSAIEGGATQPASRNWTALENLLAQAWDAGLETLLLVSYTPQWARYPGFSTTDKAAVNPAVYAQFDAFVDAMVARLKVGGSSAVVVARPGKGVKRVEYWNEANLEVFRQPAPRSNMPLYYAELKRFYARVKAGAGSTMLVGSSGCAPVGDAAPRIKSYDFCQSIIDQAEAEGYVQPAGGWDGGIPVDFWCHHGYWFGRLSGGTPVAPNNTGNWNALAYDVAVIHNRLAAAGYPTMRIWLTEMGVPHALNAVAGAGNADSSLVYTELEAFNSYTTFASMWAAGVWPSGGSIPAIVGGTIPTGVAFPFELRCRTGQTGYEKHFGFFDSAGNLINPAGVNNSAWEAYVNWAF